MTLTCAQALVCSTQWISTCCLREQRRRGRKGEKKGRKKGGREIEEPSDCEDRMPKLYHIVSTLVWTQRQMTIFGIWKIRLGKHMQLVAQPCPTLFSPMDCSPPGSSVQGFSKQEYWSMLPCPPPGDLPFPGIEPRCPALQVYSLPSEPQGKPNL